MLATIKIELYDNKQFFFYVKRRVSLEWKGIFGW